MLKIYNEQEFLHKICNLGRIILFGAGKRIYEVEKFFENTDVPLKVSMIVDNNPSKQGSMIQLWGKDYKILSFEQMIKKELEDSLVLVTVEDYGALLDDLLNKGEMKNLEIICFSHIIALKKEAKSINRRLPVHIRLTEEQMIPKKIHYCWFGGKPIPDKYKRYMESWHKFCPDYEIIEWNESNYDITKCQYMQEAYEKKMWGFVSDYARMDIIYSQGGIYLDTDVQLIKNLDDLLYQNGFAGFEDEDYVNFGCGFGAVERLPILKEMLEHYDKEKFIKESGELNLITIPIHNNMVFTKHGLVNNGEYQRIADMTIYPAKVLAGKCMYTMRTVVKPWTYAIHHYDGSWATEKARRMNARMERDMKLYHADEDY